MKASACKFCSAATKTGKLFCSHTTVSAENQGNGALVYTANQATSEDHTARLTICRVRNGVQYFRIRNRLLVLQPGELLILNKGDQYSTFWQGSQETQALMISFNDKFAAEFLHAQIVSDSGIPGHGNENLSQQFRFFTKIYQPGAELLQAVDLIGQKLNQLGDKTECPDSLYGLLLENLIANHRQMQHTIGLLGALKHSTRVELFNRLLMARDFIDAHLTRQVSLEEAASEACLSKFHFMRLFKKAFGLTVHQYITRNRLIRAQLLLEKDNIPFTEICRGMGYEDAAWFAKVYKRAFGVSPSKKLKISSIQQIQGQPQARAVA